MPPVRLASYTSTRCVRGFSLALLIGLVAFTPACELVTTPNGSSDDSSVLDAVKDDAAVQDAAATAADDAQAPVQTDAGGSDSSGPDSGVDLDARGRLDAQADAGSQDADAPGSDSGVRDAGEGIDAGAALDASGADAMNQDAGALPEAGSDAGLLTRSRTGEVRWVIQQTQGSLFCPQQSQLLWKEETLTLRDPSSRGFVCDLCPNPPFDDNGTSVYNFRSDELDVRFDFFSSITRGYSLAAFRDSLRFVTIRWKTAPKSPTKEGWTEFSTWEDLPTVEFLSYEAPLLHVRLQALVFDTAVSFREPATAPFVCFHQTPAGPVPEVCTEAVCGFRAPDTDPAHGVHVTVDLTLPVEAPHDGLSPP